MLDLLTLASVTALLPSCPNLRRQFAPTVRLEETEREGDDSSVSSEESEPDNENDADFSPPQSSASSSQSGSDDDDDDTEDDINYEQDLHYQKNPYGEGNNQCKMHANVTDTREIGDGKLPDVFFSRGVTFGSKDPAKRIFSDNSINRQSIFCTHKSKGISAKDRRAHEAGHFYSFICVECATVRRSWASLVSTPEHRRKVIDHNRHTFAVVGVDGWGLFSVWLRENFPRRKRAFKLGPGRLVCAS